MARADFESRAQGSHSSSSCQWPGVGGCVLHRLCQVAGETGPGLSCAADGDYLIRAARAAVETGLVVPGKEAGEACDGDTQEAHEGMACALIASAAQVTHKPLPDLWRTSDAHAICRTQWWHCCNCSCGSQSQDSNTFPVKSFRDSIPLVVSFSGLPVAAHMFVWVYIIPDKCTHSVS